METVDEFQTALSSGDASQVTEALEELEFQRSIGESVRVAMPGAEVLDVYGDEVPEEVASRWVDLLDAYEDFEPSPSREDIEREVAIAAAHHGPSLLALKASLVLKAASDPPAAVGRALQAAVAEAPTSGQVPHLAALVGYLLAGDTDVRAAVSREVAGWRQRDDLATTVEGVLALLDDDDVAELDR